MSDKDSSDGFEVWPEEKEPELICPYTGARIELREVGERYWQGVVTAEEGGYCTTLFVWKEDLIDFLLMRGGEHNDRPRRPLVTTEVNKHPDERYQTDVEEAKERSSELDGEVEVFVDSMLDRPGG